MSRADASTQQRVGAFVHLRVAGLPLRAFHVFERVKKVRHRFLLAAACSLFIVPATMVGSALARHADTAHKTAHVTIVTDRKTIGAYKPATITVHRGDRIVFKNVSNAPHTVSADNNSFGSPNIAIGKSWTFTSKKTGTFKYFCQYHGAMHGKIVVKP
ncbi:MAG: hypothetical protein NVS2B16_05190 [Chloroflexota bacterium]